MKNISIYCICNLKYNCYIGDGKIDFGSFSNEYRFHKCPKCGHVWDLRPELPKPFKIEPKEGIPDVTAFTDI